MQALGHVAVCPHCIPPIPLFSHVRFLHVRPIVSGFVCAWVDWARYKSCEHQALPSEDPSQIPALALDVMSASLCTSCSVFPSLQAWHEVRMGGSPYPSKMIPRLRHFSISVSGICWSALLALCCISHKSVAELLTRFSHCAALR